MRIGIAGLWHETNTYGPNSADRSAFERFEMLEGEDIVSAHRGTKTVISGFLSLENVEYVPLFAAGCWPSGPASSELLDDLIGRVIDSLDAAGPLDGILLNLHGAMVGIGRPDVERDLVEAIRAHAADTPLAAVLDLHGNPSPEFVRGTDIVIAYDTYPHVDMYERGAEAAQLLRQKIDGRDLLTVIAKSPLLTCPLSQGTGNQPMRGIAERARSRVTERGLVRVSITAGFAYSDVSRAGISVLVVTDREMTRQAAEIADETLADIEAHEDDFVVTRPNAREAVRIALAETAAPTVLADVADNVGGGSAGDGTDILRALVDQSAPSAVVMLADAEVVAASAAAGIGGRVEMAVGGKRDDLHGKPVELQLRVEAITDGRYVSHGSYMTGQQFSTGMTARLRTGGVVLIVTEVAVPPFHREQWTSAGVDPDTFDIVAAKGALAWREAITSPVRVIEVATAGACPVDLHALNRSTPALRYLATSLGG